MHREGAQREEGPVARVDLRHRCVGRKDSLLAMPPRPQVSYSLEISGFQRLLRTVVIDQRITPEQLKKFREAVDEVTRILSEAQTK